MPFPFIAIGAVFAAVILGAALAVFVLVLMAIDRAASRTADSVVSGLVSGFRGWAGERSPGPRGSAMADDPVEPAAAVPVARVR